MDEKADDADRTHDPAMASPTGNGEEWEWVVPQEVLPNVAELVIEDEAPVDAIRTEKQQRLLTDTLYVSWSGPESGEPFQVFANVGLFATGSPPPLVPDVMLSLDMKPGDPSIRENRSYFVWIVGKPPDVVIEIVSDRRGDEASLKKRKYGRMGISYYVIYDPDDQLREGVLRAFALREGDYVPLDPRWLPHVGLGLILWQGSYQGLEAQWLRWCDRAGDPIPTGRERADQERQRADQERQRADQERQRAERLAAQLRALGIDPSA
jgi:Uma2 family endonuclease